MYSTLFGALPKLTNPYEMPPLRKNPDEDEKEEEEAKYDVYLDKEFQFPELTFMENLDHGNMRYEIMNRPEVVYKIFRLYDLVKAPKDTYLAVIWNIR